MQKVLIIYRFLPHYRLEFYEGLRLALQKEGIELSLSYGKTNKVDSLKGDEVEIPWARKVRNRYLRLGKVELLWQPCLRDIRGKDLVIVEQANKLIINYYLMFRRRVSKMKLGVWGHGRNMQIDKDSLRNRFKDIFVKQCDHYFAYTEGVKDFLIAKGLRTDSITIVRNAIDTSAIRAAFDDIGPSDIDAVQRELGISDSNKLGIYCGGMYPEKRIGFLIDICKKVKSSIPEFHMLFIGSGVDSGIVEEASKENEWIHYVGPKLGNDRVPYFKLASLQLMPGLVGLAVLDSFALETPLITTEYPYHSPEIEYLINGENGEITDNDSDVYTNKVIEILTSEAYIENLEAGCRKSVSIYTIETMVENFKEGVINSIN